MALNSAPPASGAGRRQIPLGLFVVGVLIAAGASVAVTATYFELFPKSASSAGQVAVSDDLGRTVTVTPNPHRIAVFGANIVDALAHLGLGSSIVGVDCSSSSYGGLLGDYTSNQTAQWNLTSSMCVQALPGLDVEQLVNRSPNLVLATSIVSESALDEFSATYRVPVVWLIPTSLSGVVVDLQILAQLFPAAHGATHLEAALQQQLANASAYSSGLFAQPNASIPRVLLTYYVDPSAGYYTYGPGTFGASLITLAGGTSISANSSVPYPVLSGSVALAASPTVVVYGVGPLGEPLSAYAQGPDWSSLTPTKVPLDVTLFTEADPTMILVGLPALTNALHPAGH